jgi:hypothetical protein
VKTFLKYTFIVVGLYVVVDNYTGSGALVNDSFKGYSGAVNSLEGR